MRDEWEWERLSSSQEWREKVDRMGWPVLWHGWWRWMFKARLNIFKEIFVKKGKTWQSGFFEGLEIIIRISGGTVCGKLSFYFSMQWKTITRFKIILKLANMKLEVFSFGWRDVIWFWIIWVPIFGKRDISKKLSLLRCLYKLIVKLYTRMGVSYS